MPLRDLADDRGVSCACPRAPPGSGLATPSRDVAHPVRHYSGRNEAETIAAAAATLAQQDYPHLEIVLVNDRSQDATGAIMDRIAAANPGVRVVHIESLPADWLGKVYALSQGSTIARGEWLLLTDADVHFAPGVLRRVMAWSLHRNLDHLAAAPEIWQSSFMMDAAISAFLRGFCVGMRIWAVEDPDSGAYIGVGAFNLLLRGLRADRGIRMAQNGSRR